MFLDLVFFFVVFKLVSCVFLFLKYIVYTKSNELISAKGIMSI